MDSTSIQIQVLITFLTPLLLQLAKRSRNQAWAWIDQARPKVAALTAALTALITSSGISIAHTAHSVTVTWPAGATMAHGVVTFAVMTVGQIMGQHSAYEAFWRQIVPAQSNVSADVRTPERSST